MVDFDYNTPIDSLEEFLFDFENFIKWEAANNHSRRQLTYLSVRHMASYVESDIGIIHLDVFAIIKPYVIWNESWDYDGPQWHEGCIPFDNLRNLKIERLVQ